MARLFFILVFLFSGFSLPQSDTKGDESKKTTTTISFEDQLVEGEIKKPELFYLLQKRQFNYKRLIKLRENFLPEMTQSAEDISVSGSNQ